MLVPANKGTVNLKVLLGINNHISNNNPNKRYCFCIKWCLKSIDSRFAKAIKPFLKNLEILTPRIHAKKLMQETI